jgi:hypothetical protein
MLFVSSEKPRVARKREEVTNGCKKLLVEFVTGYYSLEAKHADRWINMEHSRISFVHVVKGIAEEKLYVCVCALIACVPFSALGETTEDGGGIFEGPLVLTVKLKVSFFCLKCMIVLGERTAILFCSGT